MMVSVRAIILLVLSALVALGWLPEDMREGMADNVELVVTGILGLWGYIATRRVFMEGE